MPVSLLFFRMYLYLWGTEPHSYPFNRWVVTDHEYLKAFLLRRAILETLSMPSKETCPSAGWEPCTSTGVSQWSTLSIHQQVYVSQWSTLSIHQQAHVSQWSTLSIHQQAHVSQWSTLSIHQQAHVSPWSTLSIHQHVHVSPWSTLSAHQHVYASQWSTLCTSTCVCQPMINTLCTYTSPQIIKTLSAFSQQWHKFTNNQTLFAFW